MPLAIGGSGEEVRDLQRRLAALGHPSAGDEPGTFGEATASAVRRFQQDRGLRVDAVCGPQTWSALVEAGWRMGDRHLYRRTPMLRGDDIAELQRRLGELGFDAGRVDGIFGDSTATALAEFQRNLSLTVDGICGPATVAALTRLTPRTGGGSVAEVRERDRLRRTVPGLAGRRVAVGHGGGLDALVDSVVKDLTRAGAEAVGLWDPDGSAQAAEANTAGVDVYIGFHLDPGRRGCAAAFYSGFRYESPGGKRLAAKLAAALSEPLGGTDFGTRGMSLPVLRETRMPAVVCELGPPDAVTERMADLGAAVSGALRDWARAPCDD